jgi:hypothetical protein
MYNVQYRDGEIDRSFNKVFNTLSEAEAFLAKLECEGCEGFIESIQE